MLLESAVGSQRGANWGLLEKAKPEQDLSAVKRRTSRKAQRGHLGQVEWPELASPWGRDVGVPDPGARPEGPVLPGPRAGAGNMGPLAGWGQVLSLGRLVVPQVCVWTLCSLSPFGRHELSVCLLAQLMFARLLLCGCQGLSSRTGCRHGASDGVVGDGGCYTSDQKNKNLMTLVINATREKCGVL